MNKLVWYLSDDVEDKCASIEDTTNCVTAKNTTIEALDSKTVVDTVKESIHTTFLAKHSSDGNVDQNGIEENDHPRSEISLLEKAQENSLPAGGTATCAALNPVFAENVSDTNLAAVSEDHEADFDQLLVSEDSAASEDVEPQSSPDGASDNAPTPILNDQGVRVTVKPGYVMVPILTPYYDPSGEEPLLYLTVGS